MRNIYQHLNKRMFYLIVIIYTVFLISFFLINCYDEYVNTKYTLMQKNYYNQSVIDDHINHYTYYNNQISKLLDVKLKATTGIKSVPPFLTENEKNLIDILFDENDYFDYFLMINRDNGVEYNLGSYDFNQIHFQYLESLDFKNKEIFTNQFASDYLTIIYQYDVDNYFIYFFCHESMYQLLNSNFFIQGPHITNDTEEMQVDSTSDNGYSNILKNKILRYYSKEIIFDQDYYFITHTTHQAMFQNILQKTMVSVIVSLVILAILFILTYLKIIQIVKKPYEKFILEVESLEEKDYYYINSINESKSDYEEFALILKEFKKICLYNKNNYENLIKGLKNELIIAQESSKSKSLFLANMSHEMRTPLNSIIGYTQLTKKIGFDNKDKVEEYFNNIHNSSEILLQKVNDILDLSKIESKQFDLHEKPTQINQVITEVYKLLSIQAEKKRIDFTYDIDPQIPKYLEIDSTRLKQVLINICSNAIKFTNKGSVKLEVEVFGYTSDYAILLEYTITDTGIGIPKDKIDNIFVPFVQVDNHNHMQLGTGLGLTIAKDLIRLMGGDIAVTSKENVGSIFTFITKFKISSQEKTEASNMIDIKNDSFIETVKDKQILVCEDNLINQIFMKEIFTVFNKNDIDIAKDGEEAVSMCKEKRYDLILMDIQMPNMNGLEATKIIRNMINYQEVPIIALTANAFSEQINEYLLIGMDDFLPKPVDIKRFKNVLVNHL